ncbi:ABC transporter permease subunit [Rhodococcoides kyotonense]|nr:ABC transporter permease subunit [Rhodococcus kyotonensis]
MRSTRWCSTLIVAVAVGHALLWADLNRLASDHNISRSAIASQIGLVPGFVLIVIIAVLAATAEYRTGTIHLTLQVADNRTAVVLAKAAAVCVLALLIGEIASWLAYGTAALVHPGGVESITDGAQLRVVAGSGLIYMVGAAAAVAVGMIVRNTTSAIALIAFYALIVENFVADIPAVSSAIQPWMPFTMATQFLLDGGIEASTALPWLDTAAALPPWWALLYLTAIATVLTATAVLVVRKRDT